jgi:hypothetical protein
VHYALRYFYFDQRKAERMKRHKGIVLKKQEAGASMIIILDAELGKMRCVSDAFAVCTGDLIDYYIVRKRHQVSLEKIDRIALPLSMAAAQLLFFHHVLEVCNYFILPGMSMPQVFELLALLYQLPAQAITIPFKKCFLAKLLVAIGMHPDGFLSQHASFYALLALPLDSIPNEAMLNDIDDELNVWLRSCVLEHPQMQKLNTIHFLTEYGVL